MHKMAPHHSNLHFLFTNGSESFSSCKQTTVFNWLLVGNKANLYFCGSFCALEHRLLLLVAVADVPLAPAPAPHPTVAHAGLC